MMQKIRVGIVCDTLQEAQDFIEKLAPDAARVRGGFSEYSVETNAMRIDWIPTETERFLGWRLNYVYTTNGIRNSRWFKTVIEPMFVCGIGDIRNED